MTRPKPLGSPPRRRPPRRPAPRCSAHPVPAAKTAGKKAARESRWGLARAMLVAGKTNAEILAALREQFRLPAEHSYYPRWYRSYAIKLGVITKAFAKTHAGASARKASPAKA